MTSRIDIGTYVPRGSIQVLLATVSVAGLLGVVSGGAAQAATSSSQSTQVGQGYALVPETTTPIKHVIVIIGENHTFDNVFATYKPVPGQQVWNLLSKSIVKPDGAAGVKVAQAMQATATDTSSNPGIYSISPPKSSFYPTLPQPNTTYVSPNCDGGQALNSNDARFPSNLANAPYQITKYVPYLDNHSANVACQIGAYVGDPLHRFYQMWQEVDAGVSDLFTWVHQSAGDSNGTQPPPIHQGALDMGFYNMAKGDAPGFAFMANHYAMSDNYHQAIMGGTGANHIALGDGTEASYQGSNGSYQMPPSNQIENPNPYPGSNNNYSNDGYQGGSYTNCSDPTAPGVASITGYLHSLSYKPFLDGACAKGAFYLLNNYNPGYLPSGSPAPLGPNDYTVPPQSFPTIADELYSHGISWGYFGQGWNNGNPTPEYCGICDPFQYATSVMTNPDKRKSIQGFTQFQDDVASGNLPAVSFVKPSGLNDGHPGYDTLASFETFASKVSNEIISRPALFRQTAIFITFDEGGGYYDSGYIQPIDYFGDGTRVPMILISPWTKPGQISHTYTDHASILKFIEVNWRMSPLSPTSRDHLPNPISSVQNPYVPANRPAIGNLMSLFDFHRPSHFTPLIPLT